jgi:hypothetical protein
VALKVPFFSATDGPHVLERFHREARAAANLQHANICPVFDVGEINGVHYLTMAYIEGQSLADVMRSSASPVPARQAAVLVHKLALALDEAHRNKVIHRDLKPANIMLSKRGEPVIMDFGLARRGTGDVHLTREGTILGTPSYMAPEQARGDLAQMGPACDIYSLGVILYELLAGCVPFTGDMMAVLLQLTTDEPPPPSQHRPDVDPALEAICLKAMAKEPAARYRSMAALADVLADYLSSADATVAIEPQTPSAGKPPTPVPAAAQRNRTWMVLALAGAVLLLLVAGGVLLALRSNKPQEEARTTAPGTPTEPRGEKPTEPRSDQPVAYAWPADALQAGKIPAPSLAEVKPIFQDDFGDPASGFPSGQQGQGGKHGYKSGKYFIDVPGRGAYYWMVPFNRATGGRLGDFACQLVGTAHGEGAAWALSILDRQRTDKANRLTLAITSAGRLQITEITGARPIQALRSPVSHPAIKRGEDVANTLLVVLRGRQLELYVNDVAVCDPLLLEHAIAAPALALEGRCRSAAGGTAEFDRIAIWPTDSLPSLSARGAMPVK